MAESNNKPKSNNNNYKNAKQNTKIGNLDYPIAPLPQYSSNPFYADYFSKSVDQYANEPHGINDYANENGNSRLQQAYNKMMNAKYGGNPINPQVRVVERPMNPETNARDMRYGVGNELARLEFSNPNKYRAIMQALRENPLEGGKLYGAAAVPFGMAMAGQDPVMNGVAGAGMLAAQGVNTLMDAGMVAQPFVDAYGYVQSPEYIDERIQQMRGID